MKLNRSALLSGALLVVLGSGCPFAQWRVICWDAWVGYCVQAQIIDAETGEALSRVEVEVRLLLDGWTAVGRSRADGSIDLCPYETIVGGCGPEWLLPVFSTPVPELPSPDQIEIVVYPSRENHEQRFVFDIGSEQVIEVERSAPTVTVRLRDPLTVTRPTIRVDYDDNGGSFRLCRGDRLTITLPLTLSGGRFLCTDVWDSAVSNGEILELENIRFQDVPSATGANGRLHAGDEVLEFGARSPGTTTLAMECPGWEMGWWHEYGHPYAPFEITVTVSEETE